MLTEQIQKIVDDDRDQHTAIYLRNVSERNNRIVGVTEEFVTNNDVNTVIVELRKFAAMAWPENVFQAVLKGVRSQKSEKRMSDLQSGCFAIIEKLNSLKAKIYEEDLT